MARKSKKKRLEMANNIRNSRENEVNLIPFTTENPDKYFLGFKLKNTNQLWKWDSLEDVKF